MTRDAKLFTLSFKDWKPLSDEIIQTKDIYLARDITIFQLSTSISTGQYYAIITLTEKADKIVEKYGAIITGENNFLRITLQNYTGEPLFGNKENLAFLKKKAID